MRVTNKMLSNNFLSDMKSNLENLKTLQTQMTSGKEFKKPSDDPFKVARSMQLRSSINTNKMYNENIKDTTNWLDTTDTVLGQAGDVLQRVRELLVASGNGAYSQDERQKIKDEINQKAAQISQVLNTNFDGKYIFGGTRGTSRPMDSIKDPVTGNTKLVYINKDGSELNTSATATADEQNQFKMISSKMQVEVSQGVTMKYTISASEIVQYGSDSNKDDLRLLFQRITNHLDGKTDDGSAIDPAAVSKLTGEDLKNIDSAMNNLLKIRSEVGAKQNRMESAGNQNSEMNFNMTEILSKTEDIDITEKTMEYANMQTVYMASLQTSAKVIQPSLMDYLR